jgi:CheY-like chemotaxis protein
VFLAGDGEEALKLLGEERINLVIADYQMPRMDGKELVGRINKFHPSLPVILITGRSLWEGGAIHFWIIFMGISPSPSI